MCVWIEIIVGINVFITMRMRSLLIFIDPMFGRVLLNCLLTLCRLKVQHDNNLNIFLPYFYFLIIKKKNVICILGF